MPPARAAGASVRRTARASYLALLADQGTGPVQQQCLAELCAGYGRAPPSIAGNHFSADLGPFQIKWERHTEFTSYTFFGNAPLTVATALASSSIDQDLPPAEPRRFKGKIGSLSALHEGVMRRNAYLNPKMTP